MKILKCIAITGLTTFLSGCADAVVAAFFIAVILGAVGLGEEPEEYNNESTYCARGLHPIETTSDASFAALFITRTVASAIEGLPNGTYHEEQLSGIYNGRSSVGTITISGVIYSVENESCGEGCTTSYSNHDIIAVMHDYDNYNRAVVTGDVNYSDNRGEQQSGEDTITFGSVTISDNGTDIHYEETWVTECASEDTEVGVIDTILSITASMDLIQTYGITGQLTTEAGTFILD